MGAISYHIYETDDGMTALVLDDEHTEVVKYALIDYIAGWEMGGSITQPPEILAARRLLGAWYE